MAASMPWLADREAAPRHCANPARQAGTQWQGTLTAACLPQRELHRRSRQSFQKAAGAGLPVSGNAAQAAQAGEGGRLRSVVSSTGSRGRKPDEKAGGKPVRQEKLRSVVSSTARGLVMSRKSDECGCSFTKVPLGRVAERRVTTSPSCSSKLVIICRRKRGGRSGRRTRDCRLRVAYDRLRVAYEEERPGGRSGGRPPVAQPTGGHRKGRRGSSHGAQRLTSCGVQDRCSGKHPLSETSQSQECWGAHPVWHVHHPLIGDELQHAAVGGPPVAPVFHLSGTVGQEERQHTSWRTDAADAAQLHKRAITSTVCDGWAKCQCDCCMRSQLQATSCLPTAPGRALGSRCAAGLQQGRRT